MITEKSPNLLQAYQREINSYDEILGANGQVKPHWQTLFSTLEKIGMKELHSRNFEIINKLRENGVTYNVYENSGSLNRPWQLDPIPFLIEQKEWNVVAKGLKQRALVLDLMLRDIYGRQRLIKENILPPELVYGNRGFFRACNDIKLPSENQLTLYAADIARGPDGRMWVLDNRTQAPSGTGYALENRSVMSKILPELTNGMYVSRLSPFFTSLQQTVASLAVKAKDYPNIVYLTPGSNNETYFEHAYLAAYLGYTLVQGDDLLVRDGFVWLKSIDGLEKVDVIIRRIDDEWCDPLELRQDSRLGIPGLLHAIRSGNVSVINPPGSSVLENNGLLPFMNAASRFFLGESLIMPSVATWWCGQAKEMNHVLANLPKLIIKSTNRKQKIRSVYGKSLTEAQLNDLRKLIIENPTEYVAQEEVSLSTTPALVDGKIEPRFAALRAYLVSDGKDYHVMDGGLTRSSAVRDRFEISHQYGGFSKDTWIVSDTVLQPPPRIIIPTAASVHHHTSLPSRSAENLFWVGRYCERTMATTKFLKITINALQENVNFGGSVKSEHIDILLKSLTHLTLSYPGFIDDDNPELLKNPYPGIHDLVFNAKKAGTIAYSVEYFLRGVITVSDKWSHDTWRIINLIENSLKKIKSSDPDANNPNMIQKILDKLHTRLFTFYGIISESMPRDSGFYLLEAGKLIERILSRISIIRSTFSFKNDLNVENDLVEAVLINHHLLVHYRLLYKSHISLEAMLDMILLEESLPYSLSYQLDALAECLSKLPKTSSNERLTKAEKAVLEASTKIKLTDIATLGAYDAETLYRENLDNLLANVFSLISSVTVCLTDVYFTHTVIQHSLMENPENSDTNEI
ncbi:MULTISPECIES: circularly permuted type 2 ATP-grasp protein [unclassified Arcicella]|uniref:circularly permuted type 2 ATP-grasp protein n=1 Tax=unclassified Arcicella TaxID=2644986 RepID=UPI00285D7834|nr:MULTISPECIES: circularly permuted type 2 ATP-grasp protein [unclassified Arcicella]MDR6564158.1 putative circularly permuted ATP-grasp superfamily protein/putative alpha-E superfamily protein [Arcicella sp. BE51]MDR6813911.1 putative circularly permuted ATP-grasp superfamily protein/putative alpha-E superfamily protein [Arcicella sp. BE140]MDR6825223.1 putative circularly permuted ATP-grasp superfamily protein/putative alpha-E superfamily protein [Arcicella sp. BE139]